MKCYQLIIGIICIGLMVSPSALAVEPQISQLTKASKIEWIKTLGKGYLDEAINCILDGSGDLYVSADFFSYSNSSPSQILKYSPQGDLLWNITTSSHGLTQAGKFVLSKDGSIYVQGISINKTSGIIKMMVLKFDDSGNYLWNWTWENGLSYTGATGIGVDKNENLYLTGSIDYPHIFDIYLLKYNHSSGILWNVTWGGAYIDSIQDLSMFNENSIYLGGFKNDTSVDNMMMLSMKYNETGKNQWFKTYGSGGYYGYGCNVDNSGDLYIVGGTPTAQGQILKYDTNGNILWAKASPYTEDLRGVSASSDGNFIYATGHNDKLTLVKYDKDGNFIWNTSWHSRTDGLGYSFGSDVAVNASGEIYVVGKTVDPPGDPNSKAVILKFVEVSVPEFTTIILPLTITMAIFIVILKRKKVKELMPRSP